MLVLIIGIKLCPAQNTRNLMIQAIDYLFEYVMEWVAMGVERKEVYTAASGARRWLV